MQHLTFLLHEEAGTLALGTSLAHILTPGLVIHLRGELGAGKTTITRAMLHAAGHGGHVKSPTYSLCEPYTIIQNEKAITLYHFDLYRIKVRKNFWMPDFVIISATPPFASLSGLKTAATCCRHPTSIFNYLLRVTDGRYN